MASTSDIIASYMEALATQPRGTLSDEDFEEQFLIPLQQVLVNNGEYLVPMSYYVNMIDNTPPLLIEYMSKEKKVELRRHLQIAYLLLLTQKQHEFNSYIYKNQTEYKKQIAHCELLLDLLNPYKQVQSEAEKAASNEKPLKYLGISLGIAISDTMMEWIDVETENIQYVDGKSEEIQSTIGWINQRRLYWVWASSFITSMLSAIPQDFFNTGRASEVMRIPDPYTGILSWSMYYFRFSLHLSLFLKHTIAGPWMSPVEKAIPFKQRFLTQWSQRKFELLNDSLWATCNMATFFWLTAKAGLGPWGDLFTIALLFFDLSVAAWNFEEKRVKHLRQRLQYEHEIELLEEKIKLLLQQTDPEEEILRTIKELQAQLYDVRRTFKNFKKDWDHYRLGLINETAYALGLLIAFTLLTLPFLPLAAPTLLVITMTGAAMCFVFSVIYNAVNTYLDVKKTKDNIKELRQACVLKLNEFKEIQETAPNSDELKYLFLEIKRLKADSHFEEQTAVLQTMHFYRKVMLQAIFPALVFASLVFFPLGIGLPILAAVLVIAVISYKIIENTYAPVKEELLTFPQDEFEAFCENPQLPDKFLPGKESLFYGHEQKHLPSTPESSPAPSTDSNG